MDNAKSFYKLIALFLIFLITIIPIAHAEEINPVVVADEEISELMPLPNAESTSQKTGDVPAFDALTNRGRFKNDLYSGSAGYTYSIAVPPWTNKFTPEIYASYDSHQKSLKSVLGNGWAINQNYLSRDIKNTLANTSDDIFYLHFNGMNLKLVYVPEEARYHTEFETFYNIKYEGDKWLLKTKEGKTYKFGYNPNSRFLSEKGFTSLWYLDEIEDTHGNKISYNYLLNPSGDMAIYLSNIIYGINTLNLNYGFNAQTGFNGYAYGAKIKQSAILNNIEVKSNSSLVRKYRFDYQDIDKSKFLKRITEIGNDGVSQLPPTEFTYYQNPKGWSSDAKWKLPDDVAFIKNNDSGVRILDINSDGMPDVLRSTSPSIEYWLNNKEGWNSQQVFSNAITYGFIDENRKDMGVRFVDINNDARLDIIQLLTGKKAAGKILINNASTLIDGQADIKIPEGITIVSLVDETFDQETKRCKSCYDCPPYTGHLEDYRCNVYTEKCLGNCVYYNCYDEDGNLIGKAPSRSACLSIGADVAQEKKKDMSCNMKCSTSINPITLEISKDLGYRFFDANSDGKIDIVRGTQSERKTWLGKGNTWTEDVKWIIPEKAYFVTDKGQDNGVIPLDINADGWIDLIKANDTEKIVWINNGETWVTDKEWAIPSGISFQGNNGIIIADINNDNLPDIIRSNSTIKNVWLNTGNGWESDYGWIIPEGINFQDNTAILADIDSDGNADIIKAALPTGKETLINQYSRQYLLKEIKNPYGGKILLNYSRMSSVNNLDSESFGFSGWILTGITLDNGMINSQKFTSTESIEYYNAKYNLQEKEFKGFGKVIEIKPDKSRVVHLFHQDESKKGLEYETSLYNSDKKILSKQETHFTSMNITGYIKASLNSTLSYTYSSEDSEQRIIKADFEYDSYGNIIKISSHGDTAVLGDEKYEYIEYTHNTDKWILDKPSHAYTLSHNLTKAQDSFMNYNPSGDLIRKELWLEGNNPVFTYSYDSYGNIITEIDANNHQANYVYDSTNTFIVGKINAKNQETRYGYDIRNGNLLYAKDPNGFTAKYVYDVFGRKTKEILPYDSENYPTASYVYTFDGISPEKIKSSLRETNFTANTLDRYTYLDGFGNEIQRKSESEDTRFVTGDIFLDENARIKKSSKLYYSASAEYTNPDESVKGNEYSYDALGRETVIHYPDLTSVRYEYTPSRKSIIDQRDNIIDYLFDAYNNIIRIDEHTSLGIISTQYLYDVLGKLIEIKDAKGNILRYEYDTLGRKTAMQDADLGTWRYEYDGVGNLVKQIDSRGNTILINSDELNRVVSKKSPIQSINYFYDDNTIGALSRIESPSVNTIYKYDSRLRKVSENKIIDGLIFTSGLKYDSMDRVTTKLLPNNLTFNYTYNTMGKLESVSEIISSVDYNEIGIPKKKAFLNSRVSEFGYNPDNYLLRNLITYGIQNITYAYDKKANLLLMEDKVMLTKDSMSYDERDELVSARRTKISEFRSIFDINYTYDEIGNLVESSNKDNGNKLSFTYQQGHAPKKIDVIEKTTSCNDKGCVKDWPEKFTEWNCRHKLTLRNNNSVDMNSAPVRLNVIRELQDFDSAQFNYDGSDIRFADVSGKQIASFVDIWNEGNAQGVVWLNASLPKNSDIEVYMYHCNLNSTAYINTGFMSVSEDFKNGLAPAGWKVNGYSGFNFADNTFTKPYSAYVNSLINNNYINPPLPPEYNYTVDFYSYAGDSNKVYWMSGGTSILRWQPFTFGHEVTGSPYVAFECRNSSGQVPTIKSANIWLRTIAKVDRSINKAQIKFYDNETIINKCIGNFSFYPNAQTRESWSFTGDFTGTGRLLIDNFKIYRNFGINAEEIKIIPYLVEFKWDEKEAIKSDGVYDIFNDLHEKAVSFDASGNIILKGKLKKNVRFTRASDDLFTIRDKGVDVLTVSQDGNMLIAGDAYENFPTVQLAGKNGFVIKEKQQIISFVNYSGYVFLRGNILENYSMSPKSSSSDLTYDFAGNLVSGVSFNYEYDDFNQLVRVKEKNGNLVEEYFYDDIGNRVKKVHYNTNGTKIIDYYPDGNFVRTVDNGIVKDSVFYFDDSGLVGRKDSSGIYFYHSDNLGSTNVVTDKSGNVVERTTYEPYGNVLSGGASKFLYTGKEKDSTGLYYFNARYYDPALMHFIQADTVIGDVYHPLSLNRYSYALNNPYRYTDPTGNYAVIIIVGVAAIVVVAAILYGSAYSSMNAGYVYFSQIYEVMTEEHLSYSQARKKILNDPVMIEQRDEAAKQGFLFGAIGGAVETAFLNVGGMWGKRSGTPQTNKLSEMSTKNIKYSANLIHYILSGGVLDGIIKADNS